MAWIVDACSLPEEFVIKHSKGSESCFHEDGGKFAIFELIEVKRPRSVPQH